MGFRFFSVVERILLRGTQLQDPNAILYSHDVHKIFFAALREPIRLLELVLLLISLL